MKRPFAWLGFVAYTSARRRWDAVAWAVESARYRRHHDAREFADNLERGLRELRASPGVRVGLVDGLAPISPTGKTAAQIRRHSDLVPLYDPEVRFDPTAPRLFRVGDDGTIRRVSRAESGGSR